MAVESLIIGGLVLGAIGTGVQIHAAGQQQKAQEQQIAAQNKAENARERSMEIDASRKRREMIRQSIIQRAQAQAVTTAQGASEGSGLAGAYGQIAGQTAFGMAGVGLQEGIGAQVFQANREMLQGRRASAAAETMSSIGSGISSLGGKMVSAGPTLDRIGVFGPTKFKWG